MSQLTPDVEKDASFEARYRLIAEYVDRAFKESLADLFVQEWETSDRFPGIMEFVTMTEIEGPGRGE